MWNTACLLLTYACERVLKNRPVLLFFCDTWIWVYSYHYNIQGVEKFGHSLMTTVQFQVENYFLKRFFMIIAVCFGCLKQFWVPFKIKFVTRCVKYLYINPNYLKTENKDYMAVSKTTLQKWYPDLVIQLCNFIGCQSCHFWQGNVDNHDVSVT